MCKKKFNEWWNDKTVKIQIHFRTRSEYNKKNAVPNKIESGSEPSVTLAPGYIMSGAT